MIRLVASLACVLGFAQAEPLKIDGETVAWPAEAWPLSLAEGPLVWRAAAAEWTSGPAAFVPVDQTPIDSDGIVAFAEWDAATWDERVGDPALVGFTLLTHADGRLQDADVVLNIERFNLTDSPQPRAFHRPTTLRHELGHVLGLGHEDAVDDLMHPAQEPGEVGMIDDRAQGALAAASTCCAQVQRPVVLALDALRVRMTGDFAMVRAHRAEGAAPIVLNADGRGELPPNTTHVEAWSMAGQGIVVEVPPPIVSEPDSPEPDMMPSPSAMSEPTGQNDSGCHHAPGPRGPQLWILAGLWWWRRRCGKRWVG